MSAPRNHNRLAALAADIKAAHADCGRSALQMAERALAAGHMLLEAKASSPHGEWAAWLANHVGMSARTARRYMHLARSGIKVATVAEIGIRGAARSIARTPSRGAMDDRADAAFNTWFNDLRGGVSITAMDAALEAIRRHGIPSPEERGKIVRLHLSTDEIAHVNRLNARFAREVAPFNEAYLRTYGCFTGTAKVAS